MQSGPSLDALSAQLTAEAQQVAVLQAQRAVLQRQINITNPGPELTNLMVQRTVIDNQLLKLQVDMAGTRAQLTSRLGLPERQIQPPFRPQRGPDPDIIVGMSFTLAIAVAFPLAVAYARRIWRGKPAASTQADPVAPRLDRLEQAVEAIAIEIERVSEGQRFVTKVLAERPAPQQASTSEPSSFARDATSALGEPKPFLALGAGAMEPIRVAERQSVRQSITPH